MPKEKLFINLSSTKLCTPLDLMIIILCANRQHSSKLFFLNFENLSLNLFFNCEKLSFSTPLNLYKESKSGSTDELLLITRFILKCKQKRVRNSDLKKVKAKGLFFFLALTPPNPLTFDFFFQNPFPVCVLGSLLSM